MSIHSPKLNSTKAGLGLPNTTKTLRFYSEDIGILTEVWNDMPEPWGDGTTVIAKPGWRWVSKWQTGKRYNIVKFFTDANELVGVYVDICTPVRRTEDGFEFDDLYLDV